MDADTLLHPDFAASVLAVASPGAYYQCVHGRNELIGTIVLPQAAFARVQGYDEVMEGWGGEDRDLYFRLQHAGLRQLELPVHLMDTIKHAGDLRTRLHRIQNQTSAWLINHMYLEVKQRLPALTDREPPTEIRRQFYAEIEAEVIAAQAAGRIATYSLSSGWRKFIPNHQVERILTVRVRPDSARTSGDAS